MGSKKEQGLEELLEKAESLNILVNSLLEEYKETEWEELEEHLERSITKHSRAHEKLTKRIKNMYEDILSSSSHYKKDQQPQWVIRKISQN